MNLRLLLASALVAFLSAGCGQKDATSSTATSSGSSTAAAAPAATSGPRTIEITAGDNMKFSLASIEAKPGEELKIVLTNVGTQPKEVMGHNFVLLKSGTDVAGFSAAASASKATDFIPAALQNQ